MLPSGETLLWGTLDQAALHGVLIVIRDLGLKLISVHLVGDHTTDAMRPRRNVHSETSVAPEETPNTR